MCMELRERTNDKQAKVTRSRIKVWGTSELFVVSENIGNKSNSVTIWRGPFQIGLHQVQEVNQMVWFEFLCFEYLIWILPVVLIQPVQDLKDRYYHKGGKRWLHPLSIRTPHVWASSLFYKVSEGVSI